MGGRPCLLLLAVALATGVAGLGGEREVDDSGSAWAGSDDAAIRPDGASPFKTTVLLLQGVRGAERRMFLQRLYDGIFMDVLTVQWGGIQAEDEEDPYHFLLGWRPWRGVDHPRSLPRDLESWPARSRLSQRGDRRPTFSCLPRVTYQEGCVPLILEVAKLRNPNATGFLTNHADFWLRPSTIVNETGLRLEALWHLKAGMVIHKPVPGGLDCLTGMAEIVNDRTWHWQGGRNNDSWHAIDRLHHAYGYDPTVCVGWADAFYVPRSAWGMFANVSHELGPIFHEVAIPTILQILHRHHGVPLQLDGRCWGGCCGGCRTTATILNHPCGHRMDLTQQAVRDTLASMLKEDLRTLGRRARYGTA